MDRVEEVVEGYAEESEARVRRAPSHERAVQGGAKGALARAGRAVDDDCDGAPGGGHDAREWECASRVADTSRCFTGGFSEETNIAKPRPRAPLTFDAAMETRSKRRKTEPVVDKIRRGEISVVVAIAEELPDVFTGEILPKLDGRATLNLAQVSKWYNDAVWSVDGVRSMKAKMKAARPNYIFGPLFLAASYGNVPAVRALLKSGVDVDTDLFKGLTPLHCAAEEGHTPVVKALIEAGADVDKRFRSARGHSYTSLHRAAVRGHAPVITELIKAGADVNGTEDHGLAPLHYAVQGRDEDCVALLLAHGADVHKAGDSGTTPMTLAVHHKNKKIIEMLKQAGG